MYRVIETTNSDLTDESGRINQPDIKRTLSRHRFFSSAMAAMFTAQRKLGLTRFQTEIIDDAGNRVYEPVASR